MLIMNAGHHLPYEWMIVALYQKAPQDLGAGAFGYPITGILNWGLTGQPCNLLGRKGTDWRKTSCHSRSYHTVHISTPDIGCAPLKLIFCVLHTFLLYIYSIGPGLLHIRKVSFFVWSKVIILDPIRWGLEFTSLLHVGFYPTRSIRYVPCHLIVQREPNFGGSGRDIIWVCLVGAFNGTITSIDIQLVQSKHKYYKRRIKTSLHLLIVISVVMSIISYDCLGSRMFRGFPQWISHCHGKLLIWHSQSWGGVGGRGAVLGGGGRRIWGGEDPPEWFPFSRRPLRQILWDLAWSLNPRPSLAYTRFWYIEIIRPIPWPPEPA